MNVRLPLALFLPLLVFLSACKNEGNTADDPTTTVANTERVSLLTWRYLTQDQELIDDFARRQNINVDVTVLPAEAIIAAAEQDKLPDVDVILLPSLEYAAKLRQTGQLQPFFVNAFTNGDVDDRIIDHEGYFSGLTNWGMAVVYNPTAVSLDEATSYGKLAQFPLRGGRLGMAHPDSSGLASVVAGLALEMGEETAALWAKVMLENVNGGATGSDYDQLDRMLAGELDAVLVSSGAAARWFLNGDKSHYEAAEQWRVRLPRNEATNNAYQNISAVTMKANAPHRNYAMIFIDFLYDREIQEKITNSWFEYPGQMFATRNEYLNSIPERVSKNVPVSQLENNLPTAWDIIEGVNQ